MTSVSEFFFPCKIYFVWHVARIHCFFFPSVMFFLHYVFSVATWSAFCLQSIWCSVGLLELANEKSVCLMKWGFQASSKQFFSASEIWQRTHKHLPQEVFPSTAWDTGIQSEKKNSSFIWNSNGAGCFVFYLAALAGRLTRRNKEATKASIYPSWKERNFHACPWSALRVDVRLFAVWEACCSATGSSHPHPQVHLGHPGQPGSQSSHKTKQILLF